MPKYEVNHTLGGNPDDHGQRRTFRPGEIVDERELKDAGFDLDFLTNPKPGYSKAITVVRGTEDNPRRGRSEPPAVTTDDGKGGEGKG